MNIIVREQLQQGVFNNAASEKDLTKIKRKIALLSKSDIVKNSVILAEYRNLLNQNKIEQNIKLEKLLRKRAIRTMSGIAAVTVITQDFGCPARCAYCPTQSGAPKSYIITEPAVMRAIRCKYHPYVQVQSRLRALENNGHSPVKIELIIAGGTWSALPDLYKYWVTKECYRAANDYFTEKELKSDLKIDYNKQEIEDLKQDLKSEQKRNHKEAKYKIIGLTIETRPDFINDAEVQCLSVLAVTRVELGVQVLDDKILEKNMRGHGVDAVVSATQMLRDWGFKITYHVMAGLPGSTIENDLEKFKLLFNDERFRPDQIKFYPTVVTEGSLLYEWYKKGLYLPLQGVDLQKLIVNVKKVIPPYTRLIRLIRDIPQNEIMAGNMVTNLRQVLKRAGVECHCIRCREPFDGLFTNDKIKRKAIKYGAAGGIEYFLSYESKDDKTLYGFCRLRLPGIVKNAIPEVLKGAALIRELHVYGQSVDIGEQGNVQHRGLGKRLMARAEKIAHKNGFSKIAVISGVGVRGYYEKLGYCLEDGYMVKVITN